MSKYDYSTIQKAIDFANEAHRDVNRKGVAIPYVTHVMEVYKILFNMGVRCPNMLAAAILHDIIEDTKYTYEDLECDFNREVADYVQECSRIVDGEETLQVKYDFLQTFKDKSLGSVLIKIADRYANTMDYYKSGREVYAAWYALQAYPLYVRYYDAKNKKDIFNIHAVYVTEYIDFLEGLISFRYERTPMEMYKEPRTTQNILFNKPDENVTLLESYEDYRHK